MHVPMHVLAEALNLREARLLKGPRPTFSNVTRGSYPKSGTCRFHAVIAKANPVPGQQKNAAMISFAEDIRAQIARVRA